MSTKSNAIRLLEIEAGRLNADAYEITSIHTSDSKMEYDPQPYTSVVSAILYKI